MSEPLFTDEERETMARVLHGAEWELDDEEQQWEFVEQATDILTAVLPAIRTRYRKQVIDEVVELLQALVLDRPPETEVRDTFADGYRNGLVTALQVIRREFGGDDE